MSESTLDLAAALERPTVKTPDGTTYELRTQEEFGIVEDVRLRTLLKQIDEYDDDVDNMSAEQAEQASKLLHDLATMLIVDLKEEIPDWACVAIFHFWINLAEKAQQAQAVKGDPGPPRSRRTSAASSRGSKRSTAATRKRGSTSRRGR